MALGRNALVTWGLNEIAFAELGKIDAATWEQLSLTKQGTFSMSFDAPALTQIFAEELAEPIATKVGEPGSRTIEIDLPDLSPEVLQFFGGTVATNGSGGRRVKFPVGNVVLKKMVRIAPTEGAEYLYITNATVTFNPSGGLTKTGDETFNIHVTISVNAGLGGTDYEPESIIYDLAD